LASACLSEANVADVWLAGFGRFAPAQQKTPKGVGACVSSEVSGFGGLDELAAGSYNL
jgi:hypothetical protein